MTAVLENLDQDQPIAVGFVEKLVNFTNIPFMLGFIVLAVWLSVSPILLAIVTWVYAICRIIHMVLYYKIATEENPSPRSYFFILAFVAELVLIGAIIAKIAESHL